MRHARVLSVDIGRRPAGSAGEARAIVYLEEVFRAAGYETRRQEFTTFEGKRSPNVIARFSGLDYSGGYFLVGGHYDTVVDTPGANDNASGTAVVLAVAEAFSERRVPVEFVGFGAEEYPPSRAGHLAGSKAYVAALGDASVVKGMVSVDMVGAGPEVLIVRARTGGDELQRELGEIAESLGVPYRLSTQGISSDHVPFAEKGIRAAWLWSGNHPTLHKPIDTMGIVQTAAVERTGVLTTEWLLRVLLS